MDSQSCTRINGAWLLVNLVDPIQQSGKLPCYLQPLYPKWKILLAVVISEQLSRPWFEWIIQLCKFIYNDHIGQNNFRLSFRCSKFYLPTSWLQAMTSLLSGNWHSRHLSSLWAKYWYQEVQFLQIPNHESKFPGTLGAIALYQLPSKPRPPLLWLADPTGNTRSLIGLPEPRNLKCARFFDLTVPLSRNVRQGWDICSTVAGCVIGFVLGLAIV